jgi:hypothetical protein
MNFKMLRLPSSETYSTGSSSKTAQTRGIDCESPVCIFETNFRPDKLTRDSHELFRVRAAYILQSAWRNYVQRRIRTEKIRTRNRAAAKLQALWKGYWVRSRKFSALSYHRLKLIKPSIFLDIHLRFTYGEAVFLTAVCKALRNCHFILKMYRYGLLKSFHDV